MSLGSIYYQPCCTDGCSLDCFRLMDCALVVGYQHPDVTEISKDT
jgi:hypothetical protein